MAIGNENQQDSKIWRPKTNPSDNNNKGNANPLKGVVNSVVDEAKDVGRRVGEFTGVGKGNETHAGGDVSVDDKNKTTTAGATPGAKDKSNFYDRSDISTGDKIKHGVKDAAKSAFELAGATELGRGIKSVGSSLKNAGKDVEGAVEKGAGNALEKGAETAKNVGKAGILGSLARGFGAGFMDQSKFTPNYNGPTTQSPITKDTSSAAPAADTTDDDAANAHSEDVVGQQTGKASSSTNQPKAPAQTVETQKTSTPTPKKTGNQFLDAHNAYMDASKKRWDDPDLF